MVTVKIENLIGNLVIINVDSNQTALEVKKIVNIALQDLTDSLSENQELDSDKS